MVAAVIAPVPVMMVAVQCVVAEATISFESDEQKSATASSIGAATSSAKNVKLKSGYRFANEYSV